MGWGGEGLLTSFLLPPAPPLAPQALPRRKIQLVSSNCFAEAPEKGAGERVPPGWCALGWGRAVGLSPGPVSKRVFVWDCVSLVPTSVPWTHVSPVALAPWEPLGHLWEAPSRWMEAWPVGWGRGAQKGKSPAGCIVPPTHRCGRPLSGQTTSFPLPTGPLTSHTLHFRPAGLGFTAPRPWRTSPSRTCPRLGPAFLSLP